MRPVIFAFFVIAFVAFAWIFYTLLPGRYEKKGWIEEQNVRGSSIEHQEKVYTLNFNQQRMLIKMLNEAQKIEQKELKAPEANIEASIQNITIYFFDGSELVFLLDSRDPFKNLWVTQQEKLYKLSVINSSRFSKLLNSSYDHP